MSIYEKRQITFDEIKELLGYGDWSNNSFANALCCIINDAIDYMNHQADEYKAEGYETFETAFRDAATMLQNKKNNLHNALDELGVYD